MVINKILLQILSVCFMLALAHCTGINLGTLYGVRNTNPTPEYANFYGTIFSGGGLIHKNTVPGGTGLNAQNTLKGEGCSFSLFYLFSLGDSSIRTVTRKAGIKKIGFIEYEHLAVAGFIYHGFCTKIYGE